MQTRWLRVAFLLGLLGASFIVLVPHIAQAAALCPTGEVRAANGQCETSAAAAATDSAATATTNTPGGTATTTTNTNANTTSNQNSITCNAGDLTFVICPLIVASSKMVDDLIIDIVQPFLQVTPLAENVTNTNGQQIANPTYTIWNDFMNLASVMLILVFFFVIFGTAIGFENYSIKKILPHLIIGALLVPFSWYVCVAMVDAGNVVGKGMTQLMESAITTRPTIDFNTPVEDVLGVGAVGGVIAGGFALASGGAIAEIGLALAVTILVAVLATVFTLVFRQIMIIVLTILSPFAFLAWILPNTQSLFKQWWQNFTKLILMYPIVMLIFEAGRIFALTAGYTFATTGTGTADGFEKSLVPFLQLAGLYLPLGAVPWSYKWAGGAMALGRQAISKAGSAVNSRYGKGSERDKNATSRRKAKNSPAALGATPNKGLGKWMQKRGDDGKYKNRVLGGLNRQYHAARSGKLGWTKRQRSEMESAAQSYAGEEAAIRGADARRKEQIATGNYQNMQQRIQGETKRHEADEQAKRIARQVQAFNTIDNNRPIDHDAVVNGLAKGTHAYVNGAGLSGRELHLASMNANDPANAHLKGDIEKAQQARTAFAKAAGIAENDHAAIAAEQARRRGSVQLSDGTVLQGHDMQVAAVNYSLGTLGEVPDVAGHMLSQGATDTSGYQHGVTLTPETLAEGIQGLNLPGKSRVLGIASGNAVTEKAKLVTEESSKAEQDAASTVYYGDPKKYRATVEGRRAEQFATLDRSDRWEIVAHNKDYADDVNEAQTQLTQAQQAGDAAAITTAQTALDKARDKAKQQMDLTYNNIIVNMRENPGIFDVKLLNTFRTLSDTVDASGNQGSIRTSKDDVLGTSSGVVLSLDPQEAAARAQEIRAMISDAGAIQRPVQKVDIINPPNPPNP